MENDMDETCVFARCEACNAKFSLFFKGIIRHPDTRRLWEFNVEKRVFWGISFLSHSEATVKRENFLLSWLKNESARFNPDVAQNNSQCNQLAIDSKNFLILIASITQLVGGVTSREKMRKKLENRWVDSLFGFYLQHVEKYEENEEHMHDLVKKNWNQQKKQK